MKVNVLGELSQSLCAGDTLSQDLFVSWAQLTSTATGTLLNTEKRASASGSVGTAQSEPPSKQ